MTIRSRRSSASFRPAAALAAALAVSGVVGLPAPAAAQGLFEALFGGFRRALPAPPVYGQDNPYAADQERRASSEGRGGMAFCVRTCDGRYFPVPRQSGVSAEQTCNSFCPAAETKVFSGGSIATAVARDGTRYPGLRNAYLYRERLVENCTCNGKSPAGLAQVNVDTDPTLRQGDIVATVDGLMAYRGLNRHTRTAQYTPVSAYSALSDDLRAKLSKVEVDVSGPIEVGEIADDEPLPAPAAMPGPAGLPRPGADQRAQLGQ